MATPLINKLAVFGVGLIGGSFALALRQAGTVKEVWGVGRNADNLRAALELGVIDAASGAEAAVKGADAVLLAMPVGQMGTVMAQMAPYLEARTVVTDAGSTKGDVVQLARQHLPAHLAHFVPAHPIAGAERSGVMAAKADLFRGCNVIVAPLAETSPEAAEKVKALWMACGANIRQMSAEVHDRIFAAVSHLPHLLAFALVDEIARRPNADELFQYAASGFRDFTRIAGSSPEMWRDISLANRDALLQELDAYRDQLARLRELVARGDGPALAALFAHARDARQQWLKNRQD